MPASFQIAVISSSVDAQFTARLVTDLRAAGWNVLDVAKTDLADAQRHLEQLHDASCYVLILSQEALHSAWLSNEIERVLELARAEPDRRVVPLRLMPLEVPESLATLEPVDFATVVYDAALARLQEALAGPDGLPAPESALVGAGKRKARASRPRNAAADPPGAGTSNAGDPASAYPSPAPAYESGSEAPDASTSSATADSAPATFAAAPAAAPGATFAAAGTPAIEGATVAEPATAGEPAALDEPATPAAPATSATPATSAIPADPGFPAVAAELLASTIPVEPRVPAVPDESIASVDTGESGGAGEPTATQITASRFLHLDADGSQPPPADDDIMFTVYAPGEVERRTWMRLLVYASRETRYALAQVAADAEARLAGQRGELRPLGSQRPSLLRPGARLTLVSSLPGFAVDPPAQSVKWDDGVQCHEFRLRALTAPAAIAARGSLRVLLGPLLLAEVPLAVMVREPGVTAIPAAGYASTVARAYRRIFACFASQDTDVARAVAAAAETLGDAYLRDALAARDPAPGDRWTQAISNAEVFQLFWSDHAARSPAAEREWRYALSVPAPRSRIRGLYWSSRLQPVPAELRAVSFEPLDPGRAGLGRAFTHVLLGRR